LCGHLVGTVRTDPRSPERQRGLLDLLLAQHIWPNQLERKARFQSFLDGPIKPEIVSALARGLLADHPVIVWALAAGCIEGEPRILEFEATGDSTFHLYFHAIGSGANTAYLVFRTLGGRDLSRLSEGKALSALLRIVRTSINVDVMGVSEPIRVWRIICSDASEMSADEVNANLQFASEWEQAERDRLFESDGLSAPKAPTDVGPADVKGGAVPL